MGRILKLFAVFVFIFAVSTGVYAQKDTADAEIIKIELNKSNPNIDCYTAILPKSRVIDDYILLFAGFGESVADVLQSTCLPYDAVKGNTAVFIPVLHEGAESYGFTEQNQRILTEIAEDIKQRFHLKDKKYFVGGFSMGGTTAVKFAETVKNKPSKVFAIDSPLDLERFYYSVKRDAEIYKKGIAEGDSIYIKLLNDICAITGGNPHKNIENFYKISPYSLTDTMHGAIIALKSIPVRVYIEPNEQWWLDNRQTDVLGLNILDATAFINDLRLLGNDKAELIVTHNRGFRNNGKTYHPHSWTIVDNKELLSWLKNGK